MPLTDDAFTSLLNKLKNTPQSFPPLKPEEPPKAISPKETLQKTKPKMCQHTECKKKLMLSDFACRCENYYCGSHRHAESHACAFNFKQQGTTLLEKQLVKSVASKLDRI